MIEEITTKVISEEVSQVVDGDPNLENPLVGTLRKAKRKLKDVNQDPEITAAQEKQVDALIAKLLTRRKGRATLSRSDMEKLDFWTRWMKYIPFGTAYRRGLAKYLRSKKDAPRKPDPFRDFRRYSYGDPDMSSPYFSESLEQFVDDSPKEKETQEKYYHGTNLGDLKPGSLVLPPSKTGRVSEKGRKVNLDKVFFTKDPRSALIYAGRAVQSFGGGTPTVYQVEPQGPISIVNDDPGTTVFYSPYAKVVGKVKIEKKKKNKNK